MVWVRSLRMPILIPAGRVEVRRGSCALMLSTVSITLAPGCLNTTRKHAALAVGPARLLGVLGAGHRVADVAHAQGRAVLVGDDLTESQFSASVSWSLA